MRRIDNRGELRRAIEAREAARSRLRRVTGAATAVAVGLGGVFAALAAGATHPKKTLVPPTGTERQLPALTSAPAAPLVAAATGGAPTQTPSAATTAPTASYQPPVVSSGGS